MKKWTFLVVFAFAFVLTSNVKADLPKSADESGVDHGIKWTAYVLKKGDLKNLFGEYSKEMIRFNKMAKKYWKEGTIVKKPVDSDLPLLKNWTPLPETYAGCKPGMSECIVVDLANQFLGVYKNGKLFVSYPVASGTSAMECKDAKTKQPKSCATPAGYYKILTSCKAKDKNGKLKQMKFSKIFSYRYKVWMFWPLHLGNSRFIHGTDPPNNLPGYPASHGCVRMLTSDAKALYKMTDIGTPVFIVPTTD